jgi:metal-responsive CopG/Arc/MetJ family transcriptional regulator
MTDTPPVEFVTTGLSLPRHIMDLLNDEAARQNRNRSNLIAVILADYFQRQEASAATPRKDN